MAAKKPPFILVDGSSYLYRAFHALPPLATSTGQPTGAVYGVINMLKKLVEEYQPENMAVVFDAKGKTFRSDLYPEYKAHRPPMPDDLRDQIEPIHELVDALGYPKLVIPKVEADDVIGTLARQAAAEGRDVLISTGDKDMAQLVSDKISLINTMSNTLSNPETVQEKFGISAEQIIDYLALVGDTADNIPGVPKVGPKTAVKWLNQYQSLQGIIEHADEIKGKVGDNLRASLEQLPLSYQLATIVCDVELDQKPSDLVLMQPDVQRLKELYTELELKSWLAEVADDAPTTAASTKESEYETVLDEDRFNSWLDQLQQADIFAFDTETTSLNYMQARVVGVSFAVAEGRAAYVPFGHDYPDAPTQLSEETVLGGLKPLLEDASKAKLGQNLKYDIHVLANHGIHLQGIAHDTMLESYVLDSTKRHDMDSMASRFLNHQTIHFEDVAGKGAKQLTFNQIDLEQAGPYAAEDADITLRLHHYLQQQLEQDAALKQVYDTIELPLMPVIQRIEQNGVKVDVDMLAKQSRELAERMLEIEQQSFEEAGESFNLGSPKQIQAIFFEKLGLPVIRKTPRGQPSTAEDVLQELAEEYELPRLILEHRGLSKLKSTYTDKLPQQVNSQTGRVHTSYHQGGAATGRMSSSDPNLQNIPVRSEEGRRIRQAFVANKGYKLLAADYSQIELRIMAHLSGDESLLTAFKEGRDIHRATAAEVFELALDEVSAEQRRAAKAINFGLIYGMSAFGLARQLNITRYEAQDYVDLYFERYPGVKDYMDQTREKAHDQGYVETLFGRRLYLPEINSKNGQRRQYAERTAINAPMQGTAADIIKHAMISVDASLRAGKLDARMVMQVHDELVFEVLEKDVLALTKLVHRDMESAAELDVPLLVETGVGDNWDEAH
ncbi:MAG: DNA polymerase I [Gammaproteobacteria bacterium]|nr:DNA polymerase I [Gammaproteobacteria bacterium]